jgi:phosphoglycolate phosphatase
MRFLGVLFDLDGTLLDTLKDIGDAVNRALAARGFPTHPTAAYKEFVGEGARRLVERALPEAHRGDALVREALAEYRRDYGERWNVATRPYEGIPEMLDGLAARGVRLGVLSNKPHAETLKCVRGYFPATPFRAVLGQRDAVARKPDPAGAREAARELDLPVEKILYAGDTAVDMETARAASMFAVGVTWGFRPESELRAHGAQAVAHHPREITTLVDARTGLR